MTFSCNSQRTEDELFLLSKEYVNEGMYERAEESYNELITSFPNSPKIGQYYLAQDALYCQMIDSISKNKANFPTKIARGTIILSFGEKDGGEIDEIQFKRVDALENYLENHPSSEVEEEIKSILQNLYTIYDWDKLFEMAKLMTNSNDYNIKKSGLTITAIILHSRGELIKAIDHYSQLIEMSERPGEKGKFQLYISDCYYRAGDQQAAMKNLDKVEIYERDLDEKYMSRMSSLWRKKYKMEFKKPIEQRAQLVLFE